MARRLIVAALVVAAATAYPVPVSRPTPEHESGVNSVKNQDDTVPPAFRPADPPAPAPLVEALVRGADEAGVDDALASMMDLLSEIVDPETLAAASGRGADELRSLLDLSRRRRPRDDDATDDDGLWGRLDDDRPAVAATAAPAAAAPDADASRARRGCGIL
mmetsp:Transcript_33354/g.103328  ORF Transcript_33354/g.103328 Transcript_33354/m.103328 type:complete len:162 (-) Transcript_33354:23-508(-)